MFIEEDEEDDGVGPLRKADLKNPQTLPSEAAGIVCSATAITWIHQNLLVYAGSRPQGP